MSDGTADDATPHVGTLVIIFSSGKELLLRCTDFTLTKNPVDGLTGMSWTTVGKDRLMFSQLKNVDAVIWRED